MPDPEDARAVRVSLTARGHKFGRAIRGCVRGVEAEWAERIGPRRFEELKAALELLRSALLSDA